jgi:hypothetical protein
MHARGGHPQSVGLSQPGPPGPHAFVVVVVIVVMVGRGTSFAQRGLQLSQALIAPRSLPQPVPGTRAAPLQALWNAEEISRLGL